MGLTCSVFFLDNPPGVKKSQLLLRRGLIFDGLDKMGIGEFEKAAKMGRKYSIGGLTFVKSHSIILWKENSWGKI